MSLNKINLSKLKDKEKAYLVGMLIGDGYLYHDKWRHYKINIFLNPIKDMDIAYFIISLLKKIGINSYFMDHHGCLILRFNSKLFFEFFNEEIQHIKDNDENNDYMIGFISGFIDSDGYVSYGEIVISNVNKEWIGTTEFFCKRLNISTRVWKQNNIFHGKKFDIWRLRISTSFKYEKHYSQKLNRIYGGGNPLATHHSEYSFRDG